jgi:hypothetical protein
MIGNRQGESPSPLTITDYLSWMSRIPTYFHPCTQGQSGQAAKRKHRTALPAFAP